METITIIEFLPLGMKRTMVIEAPQPYWTLTITLILTKQIEAVKEMLVHNNQSFVEF
jgi:hypothetical protein